jgi:hypothetical protein
LFSRTEGVDHVQVVASIAKGFEVHERNSHAHRLLIALHRLLPLPRAWSFKIKELTYANFYLCDFDRCDPLVLILYGDAIIFTVCPQQLKIWFLEILALDDDVIQGYVPSYSQVVSVLWRFEML